MGNLVRRNDPPSQNALRRSAFGLLGATTRDKKSRILMLAEEASLALDPEQCAKARQDLTNPRNRLACELAWLPGLSPKRAADYCDLLDGDLSAFIKLAAAEQGLARANLVAAGLEMLSPDASASAWSDLILELVVASDHIEPASLMAILNEDRSVAECPAIQSEDAVANDLSARLRALRDVIRESLDRMGTTQMLRVVFKVVDAATDSGEHRSPLLLDELMDAYGLDARAFLAKEADNVIKLVGAAKDVNSDPAALKPLLDKLEKVVSNWTQVAKPIQMSMKARGLVHHLSGRVGYSIRGLVLNFVNEADAIEAAQRVTNILREHFSQFPELADRVEDDVTQLDQIARRRAFGDLLIPVRTLCKESVEAAESAPAEADKQGQKIIATVPGLLTIAERGGVTPDIIAGVRDEVAHAICSCAIDYGNKTSKWQQCLALLDAANIFANGDAAQE
ncbi:MAG: hypothetical protein WCH44_16880, partial [Betaproteobacteria bacterium]